MNGTNGENTVKKSKISALPRALLAGFTAGFMFCFFGVLDIFAGNRKELLFAFGDFGGYIALIAAAASVILAFIIFILPKKASDIVFSIVTWLCLMGYVQATFLNGGGALNGDTSESADVAFAIIDGAVWLITGVLFVLGAIYMNKKSIIRTVFTVLLIMICVIQITGCVMEAEDVFTSPFDYIVTASEESADETSAVAEATDTASSDHGTATLATAIATSLNESEATTSSAETEVTTEETTTASTPVTDLSKTYLTFKGINEVSSGKNVIVFVLDRFDVYYYDSLIEDYPDFFDGLHGFTYFGDNMSLYSRTYPGITSMITGLENDFSGTRPEYFEKAYKSSQFLKDLKANDFKVKIYTPGYYSYDNGAPLYGIADNISVATDYAVTNTAALVGNMLALSAYRYMPTALKSTVNISTASFTGLVEYNGDDPMYEINDAAVYGMLSDGLEFDDSENSYILIHLGGCHDPYNMDAEGNPVQSSSVMEQMRGCFKLIYNYIDELKRLGVYEDSTIIITGDHPRTISDSEVPTQTRLTSLFVKPSGKSDEPFELSYAGVSQANLIPTIVKSAGIETETDYGLSYFEITTENPVKRYHKFELYVKGKDDIIVTFEVEGDGTDFNNWKIVSEEPIGYIYK